MQLLKASHMMSNSSRSNFAPAARRILLAACFAAAPALLFAQEPGNTQNETQAPPPSGMRDGGEMQQRQIDHLTKALNLSPDQVTQVKAIQNDGRQQALALRQNTSLSPQDKHSQMMALHQAEMTKVEAILTPEQKTKFEEMRSNMEQRRQEHQGAEQTPPPGL